MVQMAELVPVDHVKFRRMLWLRKIVFIYKIEVHNSWRMEKIHLGCYGVPNTGHKTAGWMDRNTKGIKVQEAEYLMSDGVEIY